MSARMSKRLVAVMLTVVVYMGTASVLLPAIAASGDFAAAVKEVEKAEADLAKLTDPTARAAFYSDDLVEIHPSGWIYNKAESLQAAANMAKLPNTSKVLKSALVERKVIPTSKDIVIVQVLTETYYEVPNPQELARAAGTMTFDPDAIARAAATSDLGQVPGAVKAPNPYRLRQTTVWARMDGRWKIATQQGTRVRDRIAPGRF